MARSGTQANENASTQYGNYESSALNNYNTQMQGYNQNLASMQANNPYTSKPYLQNQGKLASAAAQSADDQAKQNLQSTAARTGTNTAALGDTIASNARAGQRQNDQFNAETQLEDTNLGTQYEQNLLQGQLAGANSEANMYGTDVSGRSNADSNLASIQNAQDAMWGQMVAGAAGGAGAGLGAAFGGKA